MFAFIDIRNARRFGLASNVLSLQKRVVDLLKAAYGIVSHVGSHQETLNTQIILNYATYLLYDFNQAELDAVVESARADLPREFL